MRKNTVKQKWAAGKPTVGLWLNLGSPLVAEYMAGLGFDWLVVDTQHGYFSYDATVNAFQVIAATETVPLARVTWNDYALIGRLLDAGALGLVVPMVNSRSDAEQVVKAMRYPPQGMRSAGGGRLSLYGSDYFQKANEEIAVVVMIETKEAVENVEEILSTPGVDGCFIGPSDLALSLGVPMGSETHEAAVQKTLAACQRRGVAAGLWCRDVEDLHRRIEQGFLFLTCASDEGLLRSAASELVRAVKR